MYLGLLLGLVVSIYVNSFDYFENKEAVTVILTVFGTFAGASLDKKKREEGEKDDRDS